MIVVVAPDPRIGRRIPVACHRIIDALHQGNDDFLDFTRDPTEADTRIRDFERGASDT